MVPKRFPRSDRRVAASTALLALALAGCSSGGGGGSNPEVSYSFAATGASGVEGNGIDVDVVLHLTIADLATPVTVQVADTGAGSADSGIDYATFPAQTVTFPAGAVDGETRTVSLFTTTDQLVEGRSETAILRLQTPSEGAVTGGAFTATIEDADVADILFAAPASSTPDETNTTRSITIELHLEPGVTLGLAVSARIADEHTGSASPGVDYASFVTQTIVFAPGTVGGALETVGLFVIDDDSTEADETIDLELSTVSAGARLGTWSTHELTILDDDTPGLGAFLAGEGQTGSENPLVYDELLDLGAQTAGAGPTNGTLVRVTNAGSLPLELGAPNFTGAAPDDFALEVEGSESSLLFSTASDDELVPWHERVPDGGPGVALALEPERLAALQRRTRVALQGLVLPALGPVTLDLARRSLPIASDCVLAVDGARVPGGLAAVVGDLQVWGGSVREVEGSHVFLALSSAGARGYLALPGMPEPLVHVVHERGGARLIGNAEAAALGHAAPDLFCDDPLEVPGSADAQRLVDMNASSGASGTTALTVTGCRLALESDYQLFQRFNSTSALAQYVTPLVAAVSERYAIDVQTTFTIAYLGVHTNQNDGWDTQDSGGTSGALLNEFREAWDNGWPASANLAHFLSGADLGGGVAYLTVLCSQTFGFGVSGNLQGAIDWLSWSGQPGDMTWDFVVVAHEIGHNFGARHTHSYCPPLDLCASNCSGDLECTRGTLMSYCHLCGGMSNMDLYFHPATANVMRQVLNGSCLDDSALEPGDSVLYRLRFNPLGTLGTLNAALEFPHDAGNVPQPFRVQVRGFASP